MHKLFTEGLRGEAQKPTEIGLVTAQLRVNDLDLDALGVPALD